MNAPESTPVPAPNTVFDVQEVIDKPLAEVWRGLTDPEMMPTWMGVEGVRFEGNGGAEAGTQMHFRARGKERPARVQHLDPHRRVAFESVQGGVTAVYTYDLEPTTEGGTRVRLVATCSTRGLIWRLLSPLISFAMRKTDAGQLVALRKVVEGGTSPR